MQKSEIIALSKMLGIEPCDIDKYLIGGFHRSGCDQCTRLKDAIDKLNADRHEENFKQWLAQYDGTGVPRRN